MTASDLSLSASPALSWEEEQYIFRTRDTHRFTHTQLVQSRTVFTTNNRSYDVTKFLMLKIVFVGKILVFLPTLPDFFFRQQSFIRFHTKHSIAQLIFLQYFVVKLCQEKKLFYLLSTLTFFSKCIEIVSFDFHAIRF